MSSVAGDKNIYKANAFRKVSQVIAAYSKPIAEGKELAAFKGVGKVSIAKVSSFCMPMRTHRYASDVLMY